MQIEEPNKVVFKELSYKIIGSAFEVFNKLGRGLPEKDYQLALSKEFENEDISYKREVYIPVQYKDNNISKYYADFIIDNKVLLELKVVSKLGYTHVKQVLTYLRVSGLKLGILIYFTKDGVKYRRVLNSAV